jgi:hypothetical protein
MKSQILHNNSNYIMLSGEIDQSYTVPPGIHITFGDGSTFQEKDVSGETFYNDEYIVKSFKQNLSGKIELTPIVTSSPTSSPLYELPLHPHFFPQQESSLPTTPTIQKECWLTPPASPPSIIEPNSPPPPTLHAELSPPPGLSLQEALQDEQVLSGQPSAESGCCCSIL